MERIPHNYRIPRYDDRNSQLEGGWPWSVNDICYDHRFPDGEVVTYWDEPPTLGQHGDYERRTFYLHEDSSTRIRVPPGWVVPRREQVPSGDNADDLVPGSPSDGQNNENDIAARRTTIQGAGVLLQERGAPIGSQADAKPRSHSSTPTGSDYSESRQVIEKQRKAKRDRGRPHSDTVEEDDEDDADLMDEVVPDTSPKAKSKKRSGLHKRTRKKASRVDKGKARAIGEGNVEGGLGEEDEGDGDVEEVPTWDCVPGPFSAEALAEIQDLRTMVLGRVNVIGRKYRKAPAEIMMRSGFAARLGRKPNRANDFRQHYSLHNTMPPNSVFFPSRFSDYLYECASLQ